MPSPANSLMFNELLSGHGIAAVHVGIIGGQLTLPAHHHAALPPTAC